MSKIIIIDGNNYCYRAYHAMKNMKSKDGKPSSIVYGVPLMISTLLKKHEPSLVYLVIDGGRSPHRLSVLPGYKAGRKKIGWDGEDFHSQKDVMMDLVHNGLGITVIRNLDQEADDIMYKLVRKHKGEEILLCSADKDFVQLIDENVSIWNHNLNQRQGVILTLENTKEWMGYTPDRCVDYLTFIGDSSDKIPGVRGVGEQGAADFIKKYPSIKEYLKNYPDDNKFNKDKLEEVYRVSRFMIDLRYFHRKHLRRVGIHQAFKNDSKIDYKVIKNIAIDYGLNQFRMPNFIKPFKQYQDA
jgi:DNA polymerase-1